MKRLCVALFLIFPIFVCANDQAARAVVSTPSVLSPQDCSIMLIFARAWKYSPLVEKERAVWIVLNSEGQYEAIDWLHTPQSRITIWSDALPDRLVAQAHTHGDHLEPKPSSQDVSTARTLGIPVLTLTRKGIWKASPNGSVTQEVGRGWYKKTMDRCGQ